MTHTTDTQPPLPSSIASYIEHTLLRPETPLTEIKRICDEALEHCFRAVCVQPCHLSFVAGRLVGSEVLPVTVIGFPQGVNTTFTKVCEVRDAIAHGARELDMVLHLGHFKSGNMNAALLDIQAVVEAAQGIPVKVIIETALLSDNEKIAACHLVERAGAAFAKTCTGFNGGGACVSDIALMRKNLGAQVEIKASGGIRSYERAQALIRAGASRIGTSAGVAIVEEERNLTVAQK